jgi:YD repeat-containing protein
VSGITNNRSGEVQTFTYDHQDRLTNWTATNNPSESYGYDTIGNLTSKAGVSYTYSTPGNGGPHAVRSTSPGGSYTYDGNGNMLSGPSSSSFTWNVENQPTSITKGGVTESYTYDAEGQRVTRTKGSVTTYYIGALTASLAVQISMSRPPLKRRFCGFCGCIKKGRTPQNHSFFLSFGSFCSASWRSVKHDQSVRITKLSGLSGHRHQPPPGRCGNGYAAHRQAMACVFSDPQVIKAGGHWCGPLCSRPGQCERHSWWGSPHTAQALQGKPALVVAVHRRKARAFSE